MENVMKRNVRYIFFMIVVALATIVASNQGIAAAASKLSLE
jgi:hypothetical protein